MVKRRFAVVIGWDGEDEVWVTYVPALGNLSTYGASREEALANTREAILGYFEAAAKEGLPLPDGQVQAEVVEVEVATA